MDKDNLDGLMATSILDNFVKIWDKVWEKWNGGTAVYTKANGKEDYQMAKVFELINS